MRVRPSRFRQKTSLPSSNPSHLRVRAKLYCILFFLLVVVGRGLIFLLSTNSSTSAFTSEQSESQKGSSFLFLETENPIWSLSRELKDLEEGWKGQNSTLLFPFSSANNKAAREYVTKFCGEKKDGSPFIWYHSPYAEGGEESLSTFAQRKLDEPVLFFSFDPSLLNNYCVRESTFSHDRIKESTTTLLPYNGSAEKSGFTESSTLSSNSSHATVNNVESRSENDNDIPQRIVAAGFSPIRFRDRSERTVRQENNSEKTMEYQAKEGDHSKDSNNKNSTPTTAVTTDNPTMSSPKGSSRSKNQKRGHPWMDWEHIYHPNETFVMKTWATVPERNTLDQASIFVSIASLRDKECAATLRHLFTQARSPSRVYAGISEERHDTNRSDDISCLSLLGLDDQNTARALLWGASAPSWVSYSQRDGIKWPSIVEGRTLNYISYDETTTTTTTIAPQNTTMPTVSTTLPSSSELPCWCTNDTFTNTAPVDSNQSRADETKNHDNRNATEQTRSGEALDSRLLHGAEGNTTEESRNGPTDEGRYSEMRDKNDGRAGSNAIGNPSSSLVSSGTTFHEVRSSYSPLPSSSSSSTLCVCPGEPGYSNISALARMHNNNTRVNSTAEEKASRGKTTEERTDSNFSSLSPSTSLISSTFRPSTPPKEEPPTVFVDPSSLADTFSCVAGNVETARDLFLMALHSRGEKNQYASMVEALSPALRAELQMLYPIRVSPSGQNMPSSVLAGCRITTRVASPALAKGPTYARFVASLLYFNQDYFLLIDSHSRFSLHWDSKMIQRIFQLPSVGITSQYPNGYTPADPYAEFGKKDVMGMCKAVILANGMPKLGANWMPFRPHPTPAVFGAGGFAFGDAQFLLDTPYDPFLPFLFDGEEVLYSVRLWTRGWNIYSPAEANIFHYYGRRKATNFMDNRRSAKDKRALELAIKRALYILKAAQPWAQDKAKYAPPGTDPNAVAYIPPSARQIVSDQEALRSPIISMELDRYGLGKNRTLDEFLEYAQLSDKYVKTKDNENRWEGGQKWCREQRII